MVPPMFGTRTKKAAMAALCACLAGVCAAQRSNPSLRLAEFQKQEWQVEDGLPESNVRMIAQRQDGALLLATFSGVSTFNGQNFQRLEMPNAAAMNVDAVNAVLPGRNGDLWIGTDGAGVIHQTETDAVNISAAAGHENERIRTMVMDHAGTLWIATQHGVQRYAGGRLQTLPDVGIIGGDLTCLFADDLHGGMYFVTSSGMFDWRDGVVRRVTLPGVADLPTAVYRDTGHKLWIGTMHGLLEVTGAVSDHELKTIQRISIPTQVTILTSDGQHDLWVGTKHSGLWRFNADGASSWSTKDGLADDTIRTLHVDDEDNLWIGGLSGGLARWRRAPFAPLTQAGFDPGYSAVTFADSRGDLWLGTWGRGLFRVHAGTVSAVTLPGMAISTGIRTMTEDARHRLWVGTWFDGLYCFDGVRWTHHTVGLESPVNAVSVLHADAHGGLWVGTYTGLRYFPDGDPAPAKGSTILPSKLVTDLMGDADGSILVATTTGLFRVRDGTPHAVDGFNHPYVLSLSKDSLGTVWAGSRLGSLARIEGNRAYPLPPDIGLPNVPVYNMLQDDDGHLWLGTSRGVVRVLASELNAVARGQSRRISSTLFGRQDGMASADCSGPSRPSATRLPDGTLYFATSKGFVHTTAFAEGASLSAPAARILGWTFGTNTGAEALLRGDRMEVAADETDVNFRFDAKRLGNPEQTEFRYRLAGYDSGWVTTRSRYARYRRVAPGTYTFEVQARTSGDDWASPIASLPVRQQPHLYNTYTFYLLVAILGSALAAHLYTRRIRRLKGNMGIVLEERNRIARECHDSLMAGFAAISWQLDSTVSRLGKQQHDTADVRESCEVARSMVTHCQAEARRIIWDLRDTDEVTGVLSQALSRAISSYEEHDTVRTSMAVEGDEILLPPASVHHLVCIAQEAVWNALRHATPKSILVFLRYDDKALRMMIHDDGKGFSRENANGSGHFGLLVMEERARKIGGRFYLQSVPNLGTEITIDLPYATLDQTKRADDQVVRWIGL